jgi:hypothetical protein
VTPPSTCKLVPNHFLNPISSPATISSTRGCLFWQHHYRLCTMCSTMLFGLEFCIVDMHQSLQLPETWLLISSCIFHDSCLLFICCSVKIVHFLRFFQSFLILMLSRTLRLHYMPVIIVQGAYSVQISCIIYGSAGVR